MIQKKLEHEVNLSFQKDIFGGKNGKGIRGYIVNLRFITTAGSYFQRN